MAFGGSNILKILLLLLLIILLAAGGLLWFDYLGLINARERFSPVLSIVGLGGPEEIEDTGEPLMLEQERLDKQREALSIQTEELQEREESLEEREREIDQIVESLEEKEKALEEREKSFNEKLEQYDNKRANLRQSAKYYTGMPPENAVERLLEMDDQDVIDILRTVERLAEEEGEDSVVSFWLSLMPSDRAAELSRKMLKKPADQE
ncbi:MAG: periplasmic-type flagellar collar protein FlbB [Spirochaetaceae bacterium]